MKYKGSLEGCTYNFQTRGPLRGQGAGCVQMKLTPKTQTLGSLVTVAPGGGEP